jgi:polyhydroxyalkanoate synthesis regulator phasin
MCEAPESTITEEQLLKILDNCLEVGELCEEIKDDIVEQFNSEIPNHRGECDIQIANEILANLNYSYTVAIISHQILEVVSG